jgi:4-hydroxy-tetrahydrodipicolinate synthase
MSIWDRGTRVGGQPLAAVGAAAAGVRRNVQTVFKGGIALFGSVVTAMVTPMRKDGALDMAKTEQLARYLVDNGTSTVLVSGTTGESPTLSDDEKLSLMSTVVQAIDGRAKVMAGTGSNDTRHSIELARRAQDVGVDGLLLVVPYYNKPPQQGLYEHFKTIADSVDLPCMIYNIPGRTGVNLLPETLAKLAQVPGIVAVKEASGNLDQVSAVCGQVPEDFAVYSGDDSLTLPILSVGGVGVVSVASHLAGNEIGAMVEHFQAGRVKEAAAVHHRLSPLFKALFVTTNPIPVKWAMSLIGIDCGPTRQPLVAPSASEQATIVAAMRGLGLLA